MPATTMGANENFLSYVSTLSLSLRDTERKKRKWREGEKESMYENEREIHTWLREK